VDTKQVLKEHLDQQIAGLIGVYNQALKDHFGPTRAELERQIAGFSDPLIIEYKQKIADFSDPKWQDYNAQVKEHSEASQKGLNLQISSLRQELELALRELDSDQTQNQTSEEKEEKG